MASSNYMQPCRNMECSADMDCLDDRYGHSEWCPVCGHTGTMRYEQCSLEELNERRKDRNEGLNVPETDEDFLHPLTELPKYDEP